MPNRNANVVFDDEIVIPNERHRNRRKNTRKEKQAVEAVREVKEKFVEQGAIPLPCKGLEFFPRGKNQKLLAAMIKEGKQIIYAIGPAGTGKSIIAVHEASNLLKSRVIDKIHLVRPAVSTGKSIGSIPGDPDDKLLPYFAQTITHFEKFLGKGFTRYCIDKKVIEMRAVEYLRGTSFEHCFVIVEEVQNFTDEELEMMMTRIGEGCTMVFTGDQKQTDLRSGSGLMKTLNLIRSARDKRHNKLDADDINQILKNFGVVEFDFDDVQRSGIVKALTKLYFYKEA